MKLILLFAALGLSALPVLPARQQAAGAADVGQKVPQFTAQAVSLLDFARQQGPDRLHDRRPSSAGRLRATRSA